MMWVQEDFSQYGKGCSLCLSNKAQIGRAGDKDARGIYLCVSHVVCTHNKSSKAENMLSCYSRERDNFMCKYCMFWYLTEQYCATYSFQAILGFKLAIKSSEFALHWDGIHNFPTNWEHQTGSIS